MAYREDKRSSVRTREFTIELGLRVMVVRPPGFYDIDFTGHNYRIKVRYRLKDLYLIGYKLVDEIDEDFHPWYELIKTNEDTHQIPNSIPLSMNGSYKSLTDNLEHGKTHAGIHIGRESLIVDVESLH